MLNPIKEGGMGFMILVCGSPFYFFLVVDIFGNSLEQLTAQRYEQYLPTWASIIISIAFVVGFVMFFTKLDNKDRDL